MVPEEVYTVEQVAKLLKVKCDTVREWLRDGMLEGVKMGRLWRVRKRDLDRFLKLNGDGEQDKGVH